MNVVPLVCLFLLTRSGTTSAAGHGVIIVEEDSDVILPCSLDSKENIVAALFDWKKVAQRDQGQKDVFFYDAGDHYNNGREGQSPEFRGRVSHFPDQLNQGNASIIIRNMKVEDTGSYTCDFPRLRPPQTFSVELVVGAAPKPFITSLHETKDWSLLQCEAHGNPRPEVEWQDSSGNKLPADEPEFSVRGSISYVKLNITVKKTDRYRCVATQENISHQIHTDTFEHMNGAALKPYVTILDQTKDGMLLQCEVHGASPELRVEWQDSSGNKLRAHKSQIPETGSSYDIILQTTVTKSDRYRCVTTDKTNERSESETYVSVNGFLPKEEEEEVEEVEQLCERMKEGHLSCVNVVRSSDLILLLVVLKAH
ncbi:CD276 antigen homolog [Anoplopoma fimbria]|uniref:CD276 antigen homolog n=1 Tax=Anoplopoma fimbria TaxID=229290 RepID=UPI0023EC2944|nr:CD276 antigen homolog [Anoplopoma fimbria]